MTQRTVIEIVITGLTSSRSADGHSSETHTFPTVMATYVLGYTNVLCMYRNTHFGGVSCHDDGSGCCVKLRSPRSADHLKDLRLTVLTEPTVHVLHG